SGSCPLVRWRRDRTRAAVTAIRGVAWLLRGHAGWMGVNLALAAVPLVLAAALFRGRRRRGLLWWSGVAAFAAFLPNAPYVMTDVLHFAADVITAPTRRAVYFGMLPLYGVFVLTGMASYLACMR